MSREITAVVVDDHDSVRQGIRRIFEIDGGIALVGEGATGDEVLLLVEKHKPDVLLLDIGMPQSQNPGNGEFQIVPVLRELKLTHPSTALIIISASISHALLDGALSNRIAGYLLKTDALSLLLPQAVRTVHNDGIYFSPPLVKRMRLLESVADEVTITKRQKTILLTVAEYVSQPLAVPARALGIAEGSLRNQLSRIYRKLEVADIKECLIECVRRGIIILDD